MFFTILRTCTIILSTGVQPSEGLRMGLRMKQAIGDKCDGDSAFFQGDWVQTSTTNPDAHYGMPTGYASDMYYDSGTERLKWNWVPKSKCKVSYMSKTSFCDMMDAQDLEQVTYVGDSLTTEMYISLLHLIGAIPNRTDIAKPKKKSSSRPGMVSCLRGMPNSHSALAQTLGGGKTEWRRA